MLRETPPSCLALSSEKFSCPVERHLFSWNCNVTLTYSRRLGAQMSMSKCVCTDDSHWIVSATRNISAEQPLVQAEPRTDNTVKYEWVELATSKMLDMQQLQGQLEQERYGNSCKRIWLTRISSFHRCLTSIQRNRNNCCG